MSILWAHCVEATDRSKVENIVYIKINKNNYNGHFTTSEPGKYISAIAQNFYSLFKIFVSFFVLIFRFSYIYLCMSDGAMFGIDSRRTASRHYDSCKGPYDTICWSVCIIKLILFIQKAHIMWIPKDFPCDVILQFAYFKMQSLQELRWNSRIDNLISDFFFLHDINTRAIIYTY